MKKKEISVIDLFCGIGGLTHGFVNEGFKVIAGFDNDPQCKFAYEVNNDAIFYNKDINTVTSKELKDLYKNDFKIMVGCAPCQPFSSYSFKVKEKDENKINLLYTFSRLIESVKPSIVSMENVPQLADPKNEIFKDFCDKLLSLNYFVHYEVVYCPDYGIPQTRKRLVLLASKLGEIKLLPKTHDPGHYVTVRQTISHLKPIIAGEADENDPLHRSRALNAINTLRILNTKEGGSWKDWPSELLLECYKKKTGGSYRSVYGRMKWDSPAPTMTTHCTGLGNGRFGHPSQHRAISIREAALLQTFPKDYKFFNEGNFNSSSLARQIGNAVPPKLGQVIAASIKTHLKIYKIIRSGKEEEKTFRSENV